MGDAFRSLLCLLDEWDRSLSMRIALGNRTHSWRYWLARTCAHLGDSWLWGLVTIWLLRDAVRKQAEDGSVRQRRFYGWSVSLAVQIILTLTFKQLVRRKRPRIDSFLYGRGPDEHSFPSGHAMRMAVIAVWSTQLWPGWGWLLWPLTVLIGWSRVRLGIHYVGDVVAGWLLGAAIAGLVQLWQRRRGRGE